MIQDTRSLIRTLGSQYEIGEELKLFTYVEKISNDVMTSCESGIIFVLDLDGEYHMKDIKDPEIMKRVIVIPPPFANIRGPYQVFQKEYPDLSEYEILDVVKRFRLDTFNQVFSYHINLFKLNAQAVIQKPEKRTAKVQQVSNLAKIVARAKKQTVQKGSSTFFDSFKTPKQ